MKHIIESPLAEIQDIARRQLGQDIDWPDLAGALAIRICARHGMPYPKSWLTSILQSESPDFRRAPVIAAYGSVLDMVSPDVRDAWAAAIETLRGRAPFPGDRGSFEYSPRELVGVACGLAFLDSDPHGHVAWFANLLIRGLACNHFNNPQLQLAAMMALNHLDPSKARGTGRDPPDIDTLTMRELSLVAQLRFATGAEDILSTVAIEAAIREATRRRTSKGQRHLRSGSVDVLVQAHSRQAAVPQYTHEFPRHVAGPLSPLSSLCNAIRKPPWRARYRCP